MNQISNRLSVISSFYQVYVHIFCSGQCHVRWLSMWLLGSIDITESWLKGQYTPEKVGMTSDNNPQTISARTVLSESDKNDSSVTSNSMCRHMLLAPFVHTTTNYKMETFSARLALCEGNAPVTGGFPSERTVTRNFDVFFICAWTNGWTNNPDAGDLRRHRAYYDVTAMTLQNKDITCIVLLASIGSWGTCILAAIPSPRRNEAKENHVHI